MPQISICRSPKTEPPEPLETRTLVVQTHFDEGQVVYGGFSGNAAAGQMTRLGATDVWYKTYVFRNDARFTYQFSPNDSLLPYRLDPKDTAGLLKRFATMTPDPLNPREVQQGATFSFVELAAAPPQPWIHPVDNPPRGAVQRMRLHSAILNNERGGLGLHSA